RMGPLLGLLLLAMAGCRADPSATTVAPPSSSIDRAKGCALYCFITPEKRERVDFSLYSNLNCTHIVYGFGEMTTDSHYRGPSTQDEATHSYSGNFYYLRKLKKGNPTASILLGVHLNQRDSMISSPPSRVKLASSLVRVARDLHLDGLFLRVDRPFIDNSRFSHFFKDLSTLNKTLPTTLGVPLPLVAHSMTHLLDAAPFVERLHLMSAPDLQKIGQVDPLLPTVATPPEQTISYHVRHLAEKGVPKRKIVVGLSAGAVVYRNFLAESIRQEAEGRMHGLHETCGTIGERMLDSATASETVRSGHTWITSNAPTEASLGRKVRWLTSAGFGGVGIQSLHRDDPKGECQMQGGAFPALRMATDNLECREKPNNVRGCKRLCYVNSARPLEKLQPAACSHIVVEATLTPLGEVKLSPEGHETARWHRMWHVALKPRLVISLGARQTSDVWRIALAVQYTRRALIKQMQELMTEFRASGVEVSWSLGNLDFPSDAIVLEALLVEMRETMGNDTMINLAVTHGSTYNNMYTSMKKLNTTVDHVVLHSHRFHSTRQPFTGHHSPLFYGSSEILPDPRTSVEGLVAQWHHNGFMRRSKIIVGITAEPLSMMLVGGERSISNSPFGVVATPSISNLPSLLRSADGGKATNGAMVCELEKDEKNTRMEFIAELAVPFLVNGNHFVAYENERSVQMKSTWVSLNQLGGIALFDVQLDNPEGDCPSTPFPLLSAIAMTQVCETCVHADDVSPCDADFTTSCSYRLPTASEKDPLPIDRIPMAACSQIVVEHVELRDDGAIHFHDANAEKVMGKLAGQQAQMGMKRLIIAVSCNMSQAAFDDALKNGPTTVLTLLQFVKKYSLSGIELKCDHLVAPHEKVSFASFLSGLRTALFDSTPDWKCHHSLSLRLPISTRDLSAVYDISLLNTIQHVVLEPFDDPASGNKAHVNSPLFPAIGHNRDIYTVVKAWEAAGLEKGRIIVQIPAFATLQDITSNVTDVGAAAANSRVINQAQVCATLKNKKIQPQMMWDRISTYAVTEKNEWMSMQNQMTIAYKIFFAIREGLGGVGLLSLNEDDWSSSCGSGEFPLLTAAKARCLAGN
ncbi:hypothetical protein PENTCL1PPCAC_19012, partial [Pristionchus entomophagus]